MSNTGLRTHVTDGKKFPPSTIGKIEPHKEV